VNCRSIRQTTGIQNLDSEAYLNETVRVPDLPEQNRIGVFLDRKTAVLDRLMCNKQHLLHLHQERRDALISQAVIAGNDRQAWRSTRFKFVRAGVLLYGADEPAANHREEGPRYIRITDLAADGTLRGDTFQSMPSRLAVPYLLEDGDLLFARSGATVGKAFLYRAEDGPACFASYLVRLRPDRRKILPEFLYYYTQSAAYRNQVRLHTVQATIANVSAERYGNFALPLPPLWEQRAIAAALDQATNTLRRLRTTIERQLARLQEYRASLIVQVITRGRDAVANRVCERV
jgi:restriction endonuclease S subunit